MAIIENRVDHAKEQAEAQFSTIESMVFRLEHAGDCPVDGCELTDKEILEGLDLNYKEGDKATEEQREKYHDEDEARERIQEDALSVEIREDWHSVGKGNEGEIEFCLLLCTGGPAVRIIGTLDRYKQPNTAVLQYQDWGTTWTDYHEADESTLLVYARCYYFGE
jgi:hypothetical protein